MCVSSKSDCTGPGIRLQRFADGESLWHLPQCRPAKLRFFELAGIPVRAALKEKKMKRNLSLWLGLLAFALLPAFAQTPTNTQPMGKIHGHVTNPTGAPQTSGTISLSNDGGHTSKYTFPLSAAGDYAGEATPGAYSLIFRQTDTPVDKMVDMIDGVKIVAGQDVVQDDDMSRKEFVDKLPAEEQKQLVELRKHNSEAMKANEVVKHVNADLKVVSEDLTEAGTARQTAIQALGASASATDIAAKEAEIRTAKYTDIETMMLKDTQAKPDASVLWAQLGQAQLGLKKYDDAEVSYKKVLELEAAAKKPNIETQGLAYSGLGEIYARTGKVPEAKAAFDAAAKVNPAMAGLYLRNEAVIFFQEHNSAAQAAAADEAIQADPTSAISYYLKGNGLVANTTADPKTQQLIAPPGCLEAYQKYLDLAPNGPYATEVKGILAGFGDKIVTTYKAPKGKK
jgi:tetratricopeptide (TPR) repeat protein